METTKHVQDMNSGSIIAGIEYVYAQQHLEEINDNK